jgi:eukaryotic-like serine/threonine-protein kinase
MVGNTVSHYRVLRRVGGGGVGVVFEAEDERLAVKFLPEHFADDPREARAASSLDHPGIRTNFDIGEWEGRPVPPDDLLDWAIPIATALAAAHGNGIVHRDIKPSNIFIATDGQPKILDFGLAKQLGPRQPSKEDSPTETMNEELFTSPGQAVGTVSYMSPEQARGQELGARTDLFSFGAVLYEMAPGRLPFPGAAHAVVFDGALNRMPEAPTCLSRPLALEFETIIRKALEKDREVRSQSAADLKKLRRDSGRTSATLPVSGVSVAPKARWTWPAAAVLVALAAAAGFRFFRSAKKAVNGLVRQQITNFTDFASAPAFSLG